MTIEDQSLYLYRHPKNNRFHHQFSPSLHTDKSIREVEKSLNSIDHNDWILFKDLYKGMVSAVGTTPPATLVKKGRKWSYAIPKYTEEEEAFIKAVFFERLFQIGVICIGSYKGEKCFRLTDFGHVTLGTSTNRRR